MEEKQKFAPESKAEIAYQFGLGLGKGIGKFLAIGFGIFVAFIVLVVPFFVAKNSETVETSSVFMEDNSAKEAP